MRPVIIGLMCVLSGGAAFGQPYQIQQGNALDRNPQLGSGGFNTGGGRILPFNSANRITSGNVTNGASFQGLRNISDPSAFGLSAYSILPSAGLSNFNRDTYSVGDIQYGRGPSYQRDQYFSRSSTIVNTGGIVEGLNRPGTSQVLSPYVTPRVDANRIIPVDPLNQAKNVGLISVSPRVERMDSGQVVPGEVNTRLLSSPLFGAVREVPIDELSAQAAQNAALGASLATPIDNRIQPEAPLDRRATTGSPGVPGDKVDQSPLARLLSGGSNNGLLEPTNQRPNPAIGPGEIAKNDGLLGSGQLPDQKLQVAPLTSPTQAADTFTGMRQMQAGLSQPLRTVQTLADAEKTRRQQDAQHTLARPIAPARPEPAGAAKTGGVLSGMAVQPGPLRSFVGTEQSALNRYLNQAESLTRSGQYYRAAEVYELARTLDSKNPLPLLGRALALLAAGEYISSSTSLFQAIDVYDGLSQFPVDLPAFIPDVNRLDRRRADLEQRLQSREDFRLRFLLGYAEYCSGMQKLGLQDLEKAAADAPKDQDALRRFVAALALRPFGTSSRPAP